MPTDSIPFEKTGYFSSLICDYINTNDKLTPFYRSFPSDVAFLRHAEERQKQFSKKHRDVLIKVLEEQYEEISVSEATTKNLNLLQEKNTVTVTTGHQLNLFSGPLYFLYKIISTINLAEKLSAEWPDLNVVPIYWMATEDHDFEEINYFNLNGKKFKWNPERYKDNNDGAVGRFATEGLKDVLELLKAELGAGENAKYLINLFKDAYTPHDTLANATRFLANALFKDYGLIIIDADDAKLKTLFSPAIKKELTNNTAFKTTSKTGQALSDAGYNIQVSPREINLFYLKDGLRERIVKNENVYGVHEMDILWENEDELLKEVDQNPERFSPNVIMRPLYQETILPNICYIGGGGELAYWFELKDYFEAMQVPFPVILLRDSVLLRTDKQAKKQKRLKISDEELFLEQHELINRKVRQISNIDINFSEQRKFLKQHFEDMYDLAAKTDNTFLGAVKAQEVKQLKGIDHLEKRLLKAQRLKLKDEVERVAKLQNELFPFNSLQERKVNFSEYYNIYGKDLISELKKALDPLQLEFKILTL